MTVYTGSVIRDKNRVPIWWGVSSTDGTTMVPIQIDTVTGYPIMEIGVSTMAVMASPPATTPRDANRIPCLSGVSNASATTILPVSVNPANGAIQAQTT